MNGLEGAGSMADAVPDERSPGNCRHCGEFTDRGRVVGHVDQGSGPGWTVVVCPACEPAPPPVSPVAEPLRYRR